MLLYNNYRILSLFLFIVLIVHVRCIEPITTLSAVALGLGALGYNFDFIKEKTYCQYKECCNKDYINLSSNDLKTILSKQIFGQHIVNELLPSALQAHYEHISSSKKPLVMSFHGTPGTGKNFVADKIAESIYKNGADSMFVHKYLGRADFPRTDQTAQYQDSLYRDVIDAVKECPKSLFIFDEVDKMPPGVFDRITSLLDHHSNIFSHNFREAIFIFLSNSGGIEIAEKLTALKRNGYPRESTKLHDFERILELGAYNVDGGLQKTAMIERHLIDLFFPFLPLEKRHVKKCIKQEAIALLSVHISDSKAEEVATNDVVYDGDYAESGCKKISKKVLMYSKMNKW